MEDVPAEHRDRICDIYGLDGEGACVAAPVLEVARCLSEFNNPDRRDLNIKAAMGLETEEAWVGQLVKVPQLLSVVRNKNGSVSVHGKLLGGAREDIYFNTADAEIIGLLGDEVHNTTLLEIIQHNLDKIQHSLDKLRERSCYITVYSYINGHFTRVLQIIDRAARADLYLFRLNFYPNSSLPTPTDSEPEAVLRQIVPDNYKEEYPAQWEVLIKYMKHHKDTPEDILEDIPELALL